MSSSHGWTRCCATGSADPTPACFGGRALCIDAERREVWVGERTVRLTRTEFDLLSTLATRPGRVWSRLELVARVQHEEHEEHEEHEAPERTIDAHVKNLRRELSDRPPRLVVAVPGVGYQLGVDRDG